MMRFFISLTLFVGSAAIAQTVTGTFRAAFIEKINGSYYVIGRAQDSLVQIIKYNKDLKIVGQYSKNVTSRSKFYLYTQRQKLDLFIRLKGTSCAWLTVDTSLKELSYKEFAKPEAANVLPEGTHVYNPLFAYGNFESYGDQNKIFPGFFIDNSFYHFVTSNHAEYTNPATGYHEFHEGKPVIERLDLIQYQTPFYTEVKRVNASETNLPEAIAKNKYYFDPAGGSNDSVCFLASRKNPWPWIKDDTRLVKMSSKTLMCAEPITLNLDSIYPELGSTFFETTKYDAIHHRIIQIGNYTGVPYKSRWWESTPDFHDKSLQVKGIYICEFDMSGHVRHLTKHDLPSYPISFNWGNRKIFDDYRAFIVLEKGISFSDDGSVNLVGGDYVLHRENDNNGYTNYPSNVYRPIDIAFLSFDSTFQIIANVNSMNDHDSFAHAGHLEEFYPSSNLWELIVLFSQHEDEIIKKYNIYTAKGHISIPVNQKERIAAKERVFVVNSKQYILFTKKNKDKVYEFKVVDIKPGDFEDSK